MKKQDVIEHFGSGQQVAKALKISGAAVSQWPEDVPEKQAYKIERITKGKLKVGDEYDK